MIKVDNLECFNIEGSLRGMRNPLESWGKSDGLPAFLAEDNMYHIGPNDLGLAQRLIKGGPEHAKFLRQIFVSMDITAPLYFFKELDTYKVGTTANSTSTMHKILSRPITEECFSFDNNIPNTDEFFIFKNYMIENLERLRLYCIKSKSKDHWRALIQALPNAWNQTRTWTGSYANLRNIVQQREHHKLTEWHQFIEAIEKLPYSNELIFYKGDK